MAEAREEASQALAEGLSSLLEREKELEASLLARTQAAVETSVTEHAYHLKAEVDGVKAAVQQ